MDLNFQSAQFKHAAFHVFLANTSIPSTVVFNGGDCRETYIHYTLHYDCIDAGSNRSLHQPAGQGIRKCGSINRKLHLYTVILTNYRTWKNVYKEEAIEAGIARLLLDD